MWVFKYLHSLLSYIKYVLSLSMNFYVEYFFSCVSPLVQKNVSRLNRGVGFAAESNVI